MTRRDYILIAQAIKDSLSTYNAELAKNERLAITDVSYTLASALQAENQAFDKKRFLQACGTVTE